MKLKLRVGAVVLLRNVLGLPGWAKTIEDIYRGGKLLASVIPAPVGGTSLNETVEFEMETLDRDLCKMAFQFGLAKELIHTSEYIVDLVEQLELVAKTKPAT